VEGRLIVRPHPWRQLPTIVLLLVSAVTIWLWIINDPGIIIALVVIWGIYIFESILIRLIVTPEHVRMISFHRGGPVPRSQVGHVRAMPSNTVFYDHDGIRILETRMDLSRTQLLTLGNELGVNVWDHRAWYGLKKLKDGVRLNPEPFPRRPPA
jgi:hypothetical protein